MIGMRDRPYVDSTPHLHVGDSSFEDWFQAQPFATQRGIKQIARDAYAAGMGDPLVCDPDHVGSERRHFICLCPDCTQPTQETQHAA